MRKIIMILVGFSMSFFFGQVGIGTALPDSSAILDLVSTNKAVTLPKVSLNPNNISDYSFLNGVPTTSLLVYNTNASFPGGIGMYYWDGASWTHFFNDANINMLLGVTKYYSKIYPNGVSSGTNYADSNSLNPFVFGYTLATPWVQIPESSPFTITVDRPVNSMLLTFTGMVQQNNTTSTSENRNFALGIFLDNQLIMVKAATLLSDNTCSFQEFTITGFKENLSVGNHTIQLAVMNRSGSTSTSLNYGQKASSCTTISNDEARISAIILLSQPLQY